MSTKRFPDWDVKNEFDQVNSIIISFNGLRSFLIATLISFLFVSCASAQNVAVRYPSGSIQSVETAEQALAEIDKERALIEAQFANDERTCYPKFFATSCLDGAKEQRRHALAQLRPVEIEANAFKRRARVADRDKALAEKQAGEQAEALDRAKVQKDRDIAAAKKKEDSAQKLKQSTETNSKAGGAATGDRAKEHQARLQRLQAEEAANAKKRAENVAAYEKKVQQAETRQREIAAKKAEKERERKAKESVASPNQ
jgi:hypothetical protein